MWMCVCACLFRLLEKLAIVKYLHAKELANRKYWIDLDMRINSCRIINCLCILFPIYDNSIVLCMHECMFVPMTFWQFLRWTFARNTSCMRLLLIRFSNRFYVRFGLFLNFFIELQSVLHLFSRLSLFSALWLVRFLSLAFFDELFHFVIYIYIYIYILQQYIVVTVSLG